MGYTTWSDDDYSHLSSSRASSKADDIFLNNKTGKIDELMDPRNLKIRESRDSDIHPSSVAIIVALDVTGSMGDIPLYLVKHKLGTLMNTLIANGVPDPQILFLAIGDHVYDSAPLQVGQFESGNAELDKWLTRIWIEKRGGSNDGESYPLAWLVAGRFTSIDCFEKRGVKGFLFTIGDENFLRTISEKYLVDKLGQAEASEITSTDLLAEAKKLYEVYHIHAEEGSNGRDDSITNKWRDAIGQNLLLMPDRNAIAELISTTVAASLSDKTVADIAKTFDPLVAASITKALANTTLSLAKKSDAGIVTL